MDGDRARSASCSNSLKDSGQKSLWTKLTRPAHAAHAAHADEGWWPALGLTEQALAVVNTCGKALASAGAFICGSKALKQFLINYARSFIFSTALPRYLAI